jgi:DNA-binding NtrC family response regulator
MSESQQTGSMSQDRAQRGAGSVDAALVLLHADGAAPLPSGIHLGRGTQVIGRVPFEGGFKLDVPAVSRSHAALEADERGVVLKDLGSRNGTLVGGKRVQSVRLAHQDVVRIGDAVFVFVADHGREYLACAGETGKSAPAHLRALVGGYAMATLAREIEQAVASGRTILVTGETGVGKELVAAGAHQLSARTGAFVALNCAAIPEQLVESELFGHLRGAFTGATRDHPGLVRAAAGGTLFLDEIGDMPLPLQTKLLRFLETREVVPVGGTRPIQVDARVISATHRDLVEMVSQGTFRGDLYARLFGYTIAVPPLRERKEDLGALIRHVLRRNGAPTAKLCASVMERAALHDWPFNVRELVSVVERAASLAEGGVLRAAHFPQPRSLAAAAPKPSGGKRPAPSRDELAALMTGAGGNVSAVARSLERDAALVYRWLKQHGLEPEAFRRR